MAIEHADFDGIERLALVTGGEIVSTFGNPEMVKIGKCDLIEQVRQIWDLNPSFSLHLLWIQGTFERYSWTKLEFTKTFRFSWLLKIIVLYWFQMCCYFYLFIQNMPKLFNRMYSGYLEKILILFLKVEIGEETLLKFSGVPLGKFLKINRYLKSEVRVFPRGGEGSFVDGKNW